MLSKNICFLLLALTLSSHASAAYDTQYFSQKISALNSRAGGDPRGNHAPQPPDGIPGSGLDPAAGSRTDLDAQAQVFNEVLGSCKTTLENFASEAKVKVKRAENWSLAGAVAGLLGSAASGHASTIVVALLSGTAGVANTAQLAYKENGDTPQATLENRSTILQNAIAAANQFSGSQDINVRQAALQKLHVACTLYDITIPKVAATGADAP